MDDSEEWADSDRARRRRSDMQGKFYNFLNRSAQSLSRSNSQSARTQRVKDKELVVTNNLDAPRASHAAPSRLPSKSNALETSQGRYHSSARTSRATTAASLSTPPRKSSSPPVSPLRQHKHTVSNTLESKTPTIPYTYNTPPQTPSSSRNYSSPSSPTSPTAARANGGTGAELLINRSVARPVTPSNSSTGRKMLEMLLPSPSSRKTTGESEETRKRQAHKLRAGSGSSNEPLLHSRSPTSESERAGPQPSKSTPRTIPRSTRASEDRPTRTPLPTPTSLPRSFRTPTPRTEPPASPSSISRKGTPKLEFWRSATPRPPSPPPPPQEEGGKEKGKQRAGIRSVDLTRRDSEAEEPPPRLVSPQARAPAAFIPSILTPIPKISRTPPTPNKKELEGGRETRASPRVDSFMSDSMPLPPALHLQNGNGDPSRQTRHAAFSPREPPRTPGPERKHAPAMALGIQRSNSAPGVRGRLSPCLRIPSPKFLNRERSRERSREREKEKEKEREKEGHGEKRRVTPESVGAPILREPRTHVHVHGHGQVGERGLGLKANKPSLVQLHRAAHGTFDFERPGSRTSSKSGQSESRGKSSDDEREREREKDDRWAMVSKPPRISEPIRPKAKAPSPVPPLPTSSRLKPRSPPPTRTRSPLAAATTPTTPHSHSHSHSHVHTDDSTLPRLSSSLARRNSGTTVHPRTYAPSHVHGHRAQASLPPFSFEPAASAPPSATKPARDGGQYVNTHTGLIMWAPSVPEDAPGSSPRARKSANGGERRGTSSNGHASVTPRALDEATAVIAQFKSALDEAGFATLQKYVRRYDAGIIPLDGSAGLLTRVQRLLETSAPRVDERRKRQLFDSFTRVVSQVS